MRSYGNTSSGTMSAPGPVPTPKGIVEHRQRPPRAPSVVWPVWDGDEPPPSPKSPSKRRSRREESQRVDSDREERNLSILRSARAGIGRAVIAEMYGVSTNTVYNVLKGFNFQYRAAKREVTDQTKTCVICKTEFKRTTERADIWLDKKCCSRPCAGKLAAMKRMGQLTGPPSDG